MQVSFLMLLSSAIYAHSTPQSSKINYRLRNMSTALPSTRHDYIVAFKQLRRSLSLI